MEPSSSALQLNLSHYDDDDALQFDELNGELRLQMLLVALAVCIGVLFARLFLYPFLRALASSLGAAPKKREKFCVEFFNFVAHSLFSLYLYKSINAQGWWQNMDLLWEGFPNQQFQATDIVFYMIAFGYRLERLANWLLTWKMGLRRNLHQLLSHVVTVSLFVCSAYVGYFRIGMMVLYVHVVSDIPGNFVRMARYCNCRLGTYLGTPFVVALWFYERLYVLPFWIIRCGTSLDPPRVSQWACVGCLSILVCLYVVRSAKISWRVLVGLRGRRVQS